MKKLISILAMLIAVVCAAPAQTPENATSSVPRTISLDSRFDFGKYKVSAPAGLMSSTPAKGQYQASLPGTDFRLVAMVVEGKTKDLKRLAESGANSLRLDGKNVKAFEADGMKGYTVSSRQGAFVITYALLRDGGRLVTLVVTEPATLQPVGPQIVSSVEKL